MPVPIFSESRLLKPSSFAQPPQPMTFAISATITKQTLNRISRVSIAPKLVFSPIPAKKIGAKIM